MPAFAPAGSNAPLEERAKNRLTEREIGLIVDWLRRDWRRPERPGPTALNADRRNASER